MFGLAALAAGCGQVTGPTGTYCVTQISVGNTKGEDIMQKGAISRTTSCGAGF